MNSRPACAERRIRPQHARRARRLGAALALTVLAALGGASPASAGFWANEAAMQGTSSRSTFIADPGPGALWTRAGLIASQAAYYRDRGFGNVLFWGAVDNSLDPG